MSATVLEATACLAKTGDLAAEMAALRREHQQLRRQVTELRCDAAYWKSRHADALKRNEAIKEELDQAKAEIRKLNRRLFGRKSEQRAVRERSNLSQQAEAEPKPKRQRGAQPGHNGHGRRDHSHLPAREESIEVPQDQRVCLRCGKPMREMAETEDSEQIEIEVALYRRVLRRKRYRGTCSCHGCIRTITAPAPPKLIPKSRIGTSLWVHLLLAKFAFYQPIARAIGSLKQHAQGHLGEDARGVLLVDRYSAYKAMKAVKSGSLLLAFCWAHVRRDFLEVGKGYPELTDWAVDWLKRIRQLYRLNRPRLNREIGSLEFNEADQELRTAVARMESQFVEELFDARLRLPCRKVLESLRNHWKGLVRFVDDSGIPMDNNGSERLLRGPAMGRKNYYGSGAKWSGRLAETMFSILATLTSWNLNGRTWLSWYLDACAAVGGRAPKDIEPFLPWNLSSERRATLADLPAGGSSPRPDDTS